MKSKYSQLNHQIKKYHEKLVTRKEILDWKQYETKMVNDRRFNHHLETSKSIKQLDRDKLLQSIQDKLTQAEERVAKQESNIDSAWKIYNEEEASKRMEREKKIQRNIRKLELKKEKVIVKLIRHDQLMKDKKQQQEKAIQLKRDLNMKLINERKQIQDTIKQIDRLEHKNVDKALAKQNVDGGLAEPKKKGKRMDTTMSYLAISDDGGGYRAGDRAGW